MKLIAGAKGHATEPENDGESNLASPWEGGSGPACGKEGEERVFGAVGKVGCPLLLLRAGRVGEAGEGGDGAGPDEQGNQADGEHMVSLRPGKLTVAGPLLR